MSDQDIAIGSMDRLIDIEQFDVVNSSGARSKTWSTYASNVWAARDDAGGGEEESNNQYLGKTKSKFTVYNASDTENIDQNMRVKDGSDYFYIISVKRVGNVFFEIETELRDNE